MFCCFYQAEDGIRDIGVTGVQTCALPIFHKNRAEIREIFLRTMPQFQGPDADRDLPDEPRRLAMAARTHLRERFLRARVAISGANFAVAETGTLRSEERRVGKECRSRWSPYH